MRLPSLISFAFAWAFLLLTLNTACADLPLEIQAIRKTKKKVEGGDFDDKTQHVHFILKIKNKSIVQEIEGYKAAFYIVGEVMNDKIKDKGAFSLLSEQDFDLTIPKGKKVQIKTKPTTLIFDESDAARYGVRYFGYLLVVKDPSGQVVFKDTDREQIIGKFERLDEMTIGKAFDRDMHYLEKVSGSAVH